MRAILDLVLLVLRLYTWVVIASAIFSWLYAFGVVNPRNQFVAMIGRVLYQLTEPALQADPPLRAEFRRPRHLAGDPAAADLSRRAHHHLLHLSQRLLSVPPWGRASSSRGRRPEVIKEPFWPPRAEEGAERLKNASQI